MILLTYFTTHFFVGGKVARLFLLKCLGYALVFIVIALA